MGMKTGTGTHYNDLGNGPPIVFIHALGVNSKMWRLQAEAMSRQYRIISYDVRGHGLAPYSGEPVSIWTLADDLLEVMDHLQVEKAAVVGLSMGGMIAQAFAIRHPERVCALGLVSTMSEFPEEARVGLRERARAVRESGMEPMVAPAIARWFTEEFRRQATMDVGRWTIEDTDFGVTAAKNPKSKIQNLSSNEVKDPKSAVIAAVSQMIHEADADGYAAVCVALADTDLTAQLGKITCPTLILSGAQDPGVNRQAQDTLKAGISGSIEIVVPNSSHLVAIERPDEFNSHLLAFLAESI
jgi:3-oxoadipate enol-lactonase